MISVHGGHEATDTLVGRWGGKKSGNEGFFHLFVFLQRYLRTQRLPRFGAIANSYEDYEANNCIPSRRSSARFPRFRIKDQEYVEVQHVADHEDPALSDSGYASNILVSYLHTD